MTKGNALYAYLLAVPNQPRTLVKSLATNSPHASARRVTDVSLLGFSGKLEWSQEQRGLAVKLPEKAPSNHAIGLRIKGVV